MNGRAMVEQSHLASYSHNGVDVHFSRHKIHERCEPNQQSGMIIMPPAPGRGNYSKCTHVPQTTETRSISLITAGNRG